MEEQRKRLIEAISQVEKLIDQVKGDIVKGEKERDRLTKIVETPEDIEETNLSQESKQLRTDNTKLKKNYDDNISNLIKLRDQRNKLIDDHRALAEEYNNTIERFSTSLISAQQDIALFTKDVNSGT